MKIQLKKQANSSVHFKAKNSLGHEVEMYNSTADNPKAASPMELILMSIASCSSIDIVHILEKQQLTIDDLQVEVEGHRKDTVPKVFESIDLLVKIEGDIPEHKALRAVKLSFDSYCSVSKMLEASVEINYQVKLNGELIDA